MLTHTRRSVYTVDFLSIVHYNDYRKMLSRVRKWQLYRLFLFLSVSINYNGGYSDISMANTEGHGCKSMEKRENGIAECYRADDNTTLLLLLQSKMTM